MKAFAAVGWTFFVALFLFDTCYYDPKLQKRNFERGYAEGVEMGKARGQKEEQKKAVDAGVGGWIVDSSTGETKFVYEPSIGF